MPNTLRITHLIESTRVLDQQIATLEKKPDVSKTAADNSSLKTMLSQRALFQHELVRLRAAQNANVSAFFGGKI